MEFKIRRQIFQLNQPLLHLLMYVYITLSGYFATSYKIVKLAVDDYRLVIFT